MNQRHLFFFFFLMSLNSFCQKKYDKKYYKNGQLKQEGWLLDDKKIDYWKFYYNNGNLKKEGSFKANLETKYWYFYANNSVIEKEGHYINGQQYNW